MNTPVECIITKGDPTDSSTILTGSRYTTFGGSISTCRRSCTEMIDPTWAATILRTWISGLL